MNDVSWQQVVWQQKTIKSGELDLAWFEAGNGPPLMLLHGGPGHDHQLLRTLAAPLTRAYRCILPDQRGSGKSLLSRFNEQSLHIDRFIEDIEALRIHLDVPQLSLGGWSWGAALAFMYSLAHPNRVEKLTMLSPGPIPFEMLEVYQANQLRPLTNRERAVVADLQKQSAAAFQARNAALYQKLFVKRMKIMFRAWFYDSDIADRYERTFTDAVDSYRVAQVEPYIYGSLGQFQGWKNLSKLTMPALIVYGYQDFEPITQAYTLREWMPQAKLEWINQCGHFPWIEQPSRLYAVLEPFLSRRKA